MNNKFRINEAVQYFIFKTIGSYHFKKIFPEYVLRIKSVDQCRTAVHNPTTGWHSNTAINQLHFQMLVSEG